jgi:hypothetical protein
MSISDKNKSNKLFNFDTTTNSSKNTIDVNESSADPTCLSSYTKNSQYIEYSILNEASKTIILDDSNSKNQITT